METVKQSLWETLRITNDWIKVSDAKALAIIGFQGLFLTFALGTSQPDRFTSNEIDWSEILMAIAVLLNALSIYNSFNCLNPRLKLTGGVSPIYFGSIAQNFEKSEAYLEHFRAKLSDASSAEHELSGQVLINSKIAWHKFSCVKSALNWLGASAALWLLYILINFFQ